MAIKPTLLHRMPWEDRCAIARVRVLALRSLVAAGGRPSGAQLRRSVEPVVGDLLPPWSAWSADQAAELGDQAAVAGGRPGRDVALDASPAESRRGGAVVRSSGRPRRRKEKRTSAPPS